MLKQDTDLKDLSSGKADGDQFIGHSDSIREILDMIGMLRSRDCRVLIHGETGTGKELIARQIWQNSARAEGPFIPVDCSALRDTLLESQLFGHVKGAFTGADYSTVGFFRAAHNGTLFLDEIGELSLDVQAKLLRCMQEEAVTPLGATEPIDVNVRIIAATHRDLRQMVRDGTFREDLYYRLNVVRFELPPLRERNDDVIELAEYFLAKSAAMYDEVPKSLNNTTKEYLLNYSWPGNVRELSHAMEQAHILSAGNVIAPDSLPEEVTCTPGGDPETPSLITLDQAERKTIHKALKHTGGKRLAAAEILGIERRRLNRLIKKHRIPVPAA